MKKILIIASLILTQISFCQKTPLNNLLKIEYNEFRIFTPSIINLDLGTLIVSNDYSFYSSKVIKKIKKEKIEDGESIGVNDIKEMLSEIIIDRKKKILTEKLFDNLILKKKLGIMNVKKQLQSLGEENTMLGILKKYLFHSVLGNLMVFQV